VIFKKKHPKDRSTHLRWARKRSWSRAVAL
jgi:hypothetical protein